jgi:hypothetical protein
MKKIIVLLFPGLLIFLFTCSGKQIITYSAVSPEVYGKYTWQQKIDYFNSFKDKKSQFPSRDIYLNAFKDPTPAVSIAALKSIPDNYTSEFKGAFYLMTKIKNPVIRWLVCEKISVTTVEEDLPYLSFMFKDRDWMVRECAFKNIRLYDSEKSSKKYFFPIISHLYEKNAQVLKEIMKTIKWYNDPRAYRFFLKRSYVVDTNSEMIVILQELSEINSDIIKKRIWYISQNHRDYFVRKEAERLYKSMH